MKNVKIFIGCIICCFCMSMLQSYSSVYPHELEAIKQITKVKYFYNTSTKQHYTLIITESSNNYRAISVHTQLIPGIIKPLK